MTFQKQTIEYSIIIWIVSRPPQYDGAVLRMLGDHVIGNFSSSAPSSSFYSLPFGRHVQCSNSCGSRSFEGSKILKNSSTAPE